MPWSSTGPAMNTGEWLASVTAWVRQGTGCGDAELEEVVTEAWSTVWRTVSPEGRVWFKQAVSAYPTEGAVHDVLSRLAPDQVTAPVAWDTDRGWLLSLDGGCTVMATAPEVRGLTGSVAEALLVDYARLQRATVGHHDALTTAGLPDGSPIRAAELLRDCVAEMASVPADDPRHVTGEEADRLLESTLALQRAGEALANGPVPLAFDHNDLFPRNVFAPRNGGYRFFDFAESLWAHPFGSLLMLQWELIHRTGLNVGESGLIDLRDPRIRTIFDAYLIQWRDYAPLVDLRALAALALQIAPLYRTCTWLAVLRQVPDAVERHGATPRAWVFDVARPVAL